MKLAQWLFNFFVLALLAGALGGTGYLFALAIENGATIVAATLAALATVVGALIVRYYERRKAADAARRDHLGPLYEQMAGIMAGQELTARATAKLIPQFQRKATLYGSPHVLSAFRAWRDNLPDEDDAPVAVSRASMLRYEAMVRAMRNDVGISNRGLEEGDLLRAMLSDFDTYFTAGPPAEVLTPPERGDETPRVTDARPKVRSKK